MTTQALITKIKALRELAHKCVETGYVTLNAREQVELYDELLKLLGETK